MDFRDCWKRLFHSFSKRERELRRFPASHIKSKLKERDYYLRKARKSNSENDWSTYRRLRNSVTLMIRKSKANYNRCLFKSSMKNPKDLWTNIKKMFPTKEKSENAKVFKIDDTPTTDKQTITNAFCTYFTRVASSLQNVTSTGLTNLTWKVYSYVGLQEKVNPNCKRFTFSEVRPGDVITILKNLKPSKAAGHDNIPPRLIKDGAEELTAPITYLANLSLQSSLFPTSEKIAKITPVYKSSDRSLLDNYRPISILPVFSKVLERIVYNQLSDYLESNDLFSPYQFGFRRGRPTQHAVTYLTDKIRENIDRGYCSGAVYVDLRKAFDTVRHASLLGKLSSYGIQDQESLWLHDYLFNRSQFVNFDGCTSNVEKVTIGVPQGSILGPLLFALMINDIHLALNKSNILLYADDTVIYYADKRSSDVEMILNTELNCLAKWLDDNNLIINIKKRKTEFVLYGSSKKLSTQPTIQIKINNTTVNEVEGYKYLGVFLDNHLSLQRYAQDMYKKALARVKMLSLIRQNTGAYVAETIYIAMIRPILLYCYPLQLGLPKGTIERIQAVQEKANRIVATKGIKPNWDTIETTCKRRILVDVFKVLNDLAPINFKGFFQRMDHGKNTRGNNSLLRLPKARTEAGRKRFAIQAALIYNNLTKDIRDEKSLLNFKKKVVLLKF